MTDAEKVLNEAQARWMRASSVVQNFRSIFKSVSAHVGAETDARISELWTSLVSDPAYKGILVSTGGEEKPIDPEILKTSSKTLFAGSYHSLDAACLVFFHSALDAAAFDFCRVSALQAPSDWENDVKDSKISLSDVKTKSFDQMLAEKLAQQLDKFEREGLMIKVDKLFAKCKPPSDWSPMTGYKFDRDRLEDFDKQRHEIVHGFALGKPLQRFPLSDENEHYVQQTAMYLFGLIHRRYGLQLDAEYIGKYWQKS